MSTILESYPHTVVPDGVILAGEQLPKEGGPGTSCCGKFKCECKNTAKCCCVLKAGVHCRCDVEEVEFIHPRIQKIIDTLDVKTIDWNNPLPVAIKVAGLADTFKELKGVQKFALVEETLSILLSKTETSPEVKSAVLQFLDGPLKLVVDAAVLVSKNGFSVQAEVADLKSAVAEMSADPSKIAEIVQRELEERKEIVAACTSCWGTMKNVTQKK